MKMKKGMRRKLERKSENIRRVIKISSEFVMSVKWISNERTTCIHFIALATQLTMNVRSHFRSRNFPIICAAAAAACLS